MQATAHDAWLYRQSGEIHAAVHSVLDIAKHYRDDDILLLDALVAFFGRFDRQRTDEIECLKTKLTEALKWSAKPMEISKSKSGGPAANPNPKT